MKQFTAIVIGAGSRGMTYANEMSKLPDKYSVTAVAEPIEIRRTTFAERFGIASDKCYNSWTDILAQPKMADIAFICTMDEMHYEPAMAAIEKGYDIVLEKPLAQSSEECVAIYKAARAKGVSVLACHVLRYTPFYKKVKKILDSGKLGTVMSVIAAECVGDIHQSHSYIRGNWHSEIETTPILLAKSCHDIDIIQWLVGKKFKAVQSFGELTYFKEENAPEGSPVRCFEGNCPVADTCRYNCRRLYLENHGGNRGWFRGASTKYTAHHEPPTDDEVIEALRTGDYGLCVFHANNDVVDHQVVNMQFDGGATCSFSMNAFNMGGRYIRIFGTLGELTAYAADRDIRVHVFGKDEELIPVIGTEESILGGHGGGDGGMIYDIYDYFCGNGNNSVPDIYDSVANHLVGYAAERSRHENSVVDIDEYFREFGIENK